MNKTVEQLLRRELTRARINLDNAQVDFNRSLTAHQRATRVLEDAKSRYEDLSRALSAPTAGGAQ